MTTQKQPTPEPSIPPERPAAPGHRLVLAPTKVEQTHWSFGLIGFYLSCAGVALGATFAAAGYKFFGSTGWLVFGIVLASVSCVTCFVSLAAARRAPSRLGK